MRMPATGEHWNRFVKKLDAAFTIKQARDLAFDMPPPRKPNERKYHSNLIFFLQALEPPGSATLDELQAYDRLIDRLASVEEINSQSLKRTKEKLCREIQR
jgi:hypothetical protein